MAEVVTAQTLMARPVLADQGPLVAVEGRETGCALLDGWIDDLKPNHVGGTTVIVTSSQSSACPSETQNRMTCVPTWSRVGVHRKVCGGSDGGGKFFQY